MRPDFSDRLDTALARAGNLALLMRPRLLQIPLPLQKYDDPFLPFGKAIVDASRDLTCAYVFDLGAYLAIGAAGAVALERTMAYAGTDSHALTILHGPFASPGYADAARDGGFAADAVTITDESLIDAYAGDGQHGAFVVRRGEAPVIVPLPGQAGVFWQDADLFTLLTPDARPVQIRLAGERVLYAGRGEDFAGRVRAALREMRA